MTIIKYDDLVESIAASLQFISYYHPADYIRHLARAYEQERSPAARDAIAQILDQFAFVCRESPADLPGHRHRQCVHEDWHGGAFFRVPRFDCRCGQ